ncbi:hypothetical protein [Spongiibacter tropicus]|uniref:hypothetical protein n=1 Tax=Spongiibacter tropicus TaxID=454602 RepID=UPI0003B60877|nr:hypothetical protein [Spongiibacter tropicus]
MSSEEESEVVEEIQYETIVDFLEGTPPNKMTRISDLSEHKILRGGRFFQDILRTPEIQLHCPGEACNGTRFFRCVAGVGKELSKKYQYFYLTYRCSNCQAHTKTFSLGARIGAEGEPEGELYKFGELPTYGPPTPPRLIKLIGPDRDTFLKGRRCENQGLGIGSFIYYRRVVESQKNRILNEIIKVSEKIGAPEEKVEVLKAAINETQFSNALDMAKDAIPESLLIDGHSPILLLHSALSEGVHALTDEECLSIASSVRVVLGELSDRLSQALKDEAELSKALSVLMHHKND